MAMNALRLVLRRFFRRRQLEQELNDQPRRTSRMEARLRVEEGESLRKRGAGAGGAEAISGTSGLVAEVTRASGDSLGWTGRVDGRFAIPARLRAPRCFRRR